MNTDYLTHYGVKGMKWGVRKDRKRKTAIRLMNTFSKKAENFYNTSEKLYNNGVKVSRAKKDSDVKSQRRKVTENDKYLYTHVEPAYRRAMKNAMVKSMIDAEEENYKKNTKHKVNKVIDRFHEAEWKLTGASGNMVDAFLDFDYNPDLKKKPRINKKLNGNYDMIVR